ncbi:MAG: hypothetical protein GEU28_07000 [Dehalococcoidia bacterium]|nr:hypothetical protein [Dehalococcoidia bacterium]
MAERKENQGSPAAVAEEAPVCRHRWVIEPPAGATSRGKCKFCGSVREFSNAGETIWEHRGMNANAAPKKAKSSFGSLD